MRLRTGSYFTPMNAELRPPSAPARFRDLRSHGTESPRAAVPCDLRRRYTAPMTQEASELLKKALALSTDERAQLVDSLLESLDERHEDPAAVEAAWNDEIARRIGELDSSKAKTIPWEEVRQRISAKLTNGR